MDNRALASALETALGRPLLASELDRFSRYATELARFGDKLNLTAIRSGEEVIDKHFADSLLAAEFVPAGSLLDVGAGAGFPGVPIAIVRPEVRVTLVEAVKKKVGFLKSLLANLGLPNAVAVHHHLDEQPELGAFDTAVCRALTDLSSWLRLAAPHVGGPGRVIAMLAQTPARETVESDARKAGFRLVSLNDRRLPISKDPRCVAVFELERNAGSERPK